MHKRPPYEAVFYCLKFFFSYAAVRWILSIFGLTFSRRILIMNTYYLIMDTYSHT